MNETKLRNADANLEVEGILSEKALELITDKNNKNVIRGYVVFKLNDLDFVTVNVYVSEFTKNGEQSKAYPNVLTVMNEYKSIAEVGEDAADRVRCKSVQVQPNSYVGKEDLMVHENVRYSASFFTRITDPTKYEPTARMEIEAYVQSVIDEFTVQGEATGRLKVKLYIPTYKGVEPMDAYISETIAEDFKDMVSIGQTVLLAGMPINRNEVKENVIHMAMGGDIVKKSSKRISEIVFDQANPYDEDDPKSFSTEAIRAGLVERDLRLKKDKEQLELAKKTGGATSAVKPAAAQGRTLPKFMNM